MEQRVAGAESAIAVRLAPVDKVPVHAPVGQTVRVSIEHLAIEPWETIAPKPLFGALP